MPPPFRKQRLGEEMYPREATIVDVVKYRGKVSKYYMYVIQVTTADGTEYFIFRRYSAFYTLQENLENKFPIEAGSINMSDRTLPYLPPKKYGGRSSVRSVAEERAPQLITYLRELSELPKKIYHDDLVRSFLREQLYDDIPYELPASGPIFKEGQPVEQATKPKPMIPSLRGLGKAAPPSTSKGKGPRVEAEYAYTADGDDELTFKKGTVISLHRIVDENWMEGELAGKVGLFPSNYVTVIEPLPADEDDEFDDDEFDEDNMYVNVHYQGQRREVILQSYVATDPTHRDLFKVVSRALNDTNIVLNYRDPAGDLIVVGDDADVGVMVSEAQWTPPQNASFVSWELHITKAGNFKPYNVAPY